MKLIHRSVFPARTLLSGIAWACLTAYCPVHGQTGVYTQDGGSNSQTGQQYVATVIDQSGIYVYAGGELTLGTPTITKTGDASSTILSSQRGFNAGLLAAASGKVSINGGAVTTDANGANGLFATGFGSQIGMTGGTVATTGDFSDGVAVTYEGEAFLTDVHVTTLQLACPALSVGYGGGTITVSGGIFATAGGIAPAISSCGVVAVANAVLTARAGFGAVVEGANAVYLTRCTLDAVLGGAKFEQAPGSTGTAVGSGVVIVNGGSFNALGGDLFLLAASNGNITLTGGATVSTGSHNLVHATSGSAANFLANREVIAGNLVTDGTSTITAILQNSTKLIGRVNPSGVGEDSLTIDGTSTWHVNGPSTLTNLTNAGTIGFINDGLTIDVSGAYAQAASGTLSIVLAGTAAGSNYDQLAVAGAATLAGTLEVDAASGFTPRPGESFNILTYGIKAGSFKRLTSHSGLLYAIRYGGTEATITILATSSSSRAPEIIGQPTSVRADPGASVTFTVTAEGIGTLTYQWYVGGRAIPGATNASYTIDRVNGANVGSYGVIVTNAVGSATSAPAILKIQASANAVPVVTVAVQGDGKIVEGGENGKVLFSRTGDLTGALSVSYQLRGTAISGEDYLGTDGAALPGTLVIPVGAASAKLKIVATAGAKASPLETVNVVLAAGPAGNYGLGSVVKAKLQLVGK